MPYHELVVDTVPNLNPAWRLGRAISDPTNFTGECLVMKHNFSMLDLEAFVAVGSHLNYRAAAQSLNISPSVLSRRVKKLERTLNTQLLIRTTRDVKLTIPGKEIYARAQLILADVEELLDSGKDSNQYATSVTIGCTNLYTPKFMPESVRRFSRVFPNIPVQVITPGVTGILDAVRGGTADFGVGDMGLEEPSLEFVPTFFDRVVLAVPADHPFVGRDRVEWSEISEERFISVSKGAPLRAMLDFELAKSGSKISIFHEVGNSFTALSFVTSGLGITAVTELAARSFSRPIATIPLVSPEVVCSRALIRARGRFMRPAAEAFWELLTVEWADIVGSMKMEDG